MISFSGIDSSGKSTQISLLEDKLRSRGIKYKVIWGRGGWTPGLEFVKNIVRKDKGLSEEEKANYRKSIHSNPRKRRVLLIGAILDLFLYFGIYYRLQELLGYKVICDRFILDTYVDFKVNYSEFPFEEWLIWKLLMAFVPKPTISILLVVPAELSLSRSIEKGEGYIEDLETRRKKIELYCDLARRGKWSAVIDSSQPVQQISFDILKILHL